MKLEEYDRQLLKWVKNHYWDSLEKDKDLILRHMRTFAGDLQDASQPISAPDEAEHQTRRTQRILKSRKLLKNTLNTVKR